MTLDINGLFDVKKFMATKESQIVKRWQQDGSVLVATASTENRQTARTIYTVTSGKTLYISQIVIVCTEAWNDDPEIQDGTNGTKKINCIPKGDASAVLSIVFDTPIKFETSMYWKPQGTSGSSKIMLGGWEE